jgi:hypothetical protein
MKQIFLVALCGVFLVSCKNEVKMANTSETVEITLQTNHSTEMKLNNNEKWPVNTEMKPHILQAEELVNSYLETHNTDYVGLAQKLKELHTNFIKSCTMNGASHEELHKWLQPHTALIEKLEKTTTPEEGKQTAQQVVASFQQYHNYFN